MTSARPLLLLLLAAACSFGPSTLQLKHSTDLETRKVKRIAVFIPGAMARDQGKVSSTGPAAAAARSPERDPSELLGKIVYSAMASLPNWQIVSEAEVREVAETVPDSSEAARLKTIGEMAYADAVLTARVLRFRERVGAEWGIKSPASVAFVLDLVDVRKGDIIWSARFDETQKSPAENLLVLGDIGQRGIKWLSAEQLAQEGVRKAVAQLHQIIAP